MCYPLLRNRKEGFLYMEKLNVEFSSNTLLLVVYLGRIWNIFILTIWKGSYITWSYNVMTIEWVDFNAHTCNCYFCGDTRASAMFVITYMLGSWAWYFCTVMQAQVCQVVDELVSFALVSILPLITLNRGIIDAPFPKRVGEGYQKHTSPITSLNEPT